MENKRITSKKRQAMYDRLCEDSEHPTAEMLYNRLKSNYPELSLATVYRNLSVLEEEGLVVSIGNVGGQERYDARIDPHAHFSCDCCRRVADIELGDELETLVGNLERRMGCMAQSYALLVKGICRDCREKIT